MSNKQNDIFNETVGETVLEGDCLEKLNPLCEGTGIGESCGKRKVQGGDFCQFHTDNLPI